MLDQRIADGGTKVVTWDGAPWTKASQRGLGDKAPGTSAGQISEAHGL